MTEIVGFQLPEVFEWVYTTLKNDATLAAQVPGGWHEHPAPEGTTFPYGTFQVQAGVEDIDAVGSRRIWEEVLLLVRVIREGRSTVALKTAADRMDTLLHRASGTTDQGRVLSCVRDGVFHLPELSQGKSYRHLGGFYRVLAQPLAV